MNYHLLRYTCFGYVGMMLACAPVSTQVGSNEVGTGGSSGAGGSVGGAAATGGASTGGASATNAIDRAKKMMREKYPECASFISDTNPLIKNGIIQFDCLSATDGPLYYHRLSDGSLISTCGGACMAPDETQRKVCWTQCPPPDFGDCVAATGTTAALAPCAEVSVCMADQLGVYSTSGTWACQGIEGSSECRGTVYQSFVYEDDQVKVLLFFNPSVVGNYSTESFRAALFQYDIALKMPWLNRAFAATGSTAGFSSEISGTTADALNLSYADGRLTLNSAALPVSAPSFWVDLNGDERCVTEDVVGHCACEYAVQPPLYLHLSLPVQQPQ